MRIYMAGVWTANSAGASENSEIAAPVIAKYPWDLESYHYVKGRDQVMQDYYVPLNKTIFLDSGAFSMFTQGIEVNLREYADFIERNKNIIHIASNLDVIGRGKEQETYDNQRKLEDMGALVAPVHHARDADHWLQRYLDDGYEWIFLGGMVPESKKYLQEWLDRIWHRYLCNKDGTAKVKIHGFGLTDLDLMFRYPWFSVDSTSWAMKAAFGQIMIDLPHRDLVITVSDESPQLKRLGGHIDNMDPVTQKMFADRIAELGYDLALLRTHYGWRRHFNICYFDRAQHRRATTFKKTETGLFE